MYLQIFEQGFQISPQIRTNFGILKIVKISVARVQSVPAAAKTRINTFYVNWSPQHNVSVNETNASGGYFEMWSPFNITASESVLPF